MEALTIALFGAALLLCITLDLNILYALSAGLVIFLAYGLRRGFSLRELGKAAWEGVFSARNVLTTFLLIGIMTGLWRLGGTISEIVCLAAGLMRPAIFLLAVFLLCCMVSLLIGTSFGTAATMGVICATMGKTMGVPLPYLGGAVLAGAFFGDRCSPVSTSALLVSELTKTDLFDNIRSMLRTAALPFALSCVIYLLLGFTLTGQGELPDLRALFAPAFTLRYSALLPAAVILLLSLCRVPVKKAMLCSIISAVPVCLFLQGASLPELLRTAVLGYVCPAEELSAMIDGGGLLSMLRSAAIVCISSAYSGIFRTTGLLRQLQSRIASLEERITPYGAVLVTSVLAGMLACNQTLAIMLTHQLCAGDRDGSETALYLANSAVVTSPLIPWSIACAVPLSSVGAPSRSAALAVFLYLLPLCELCKAFVRQHREAKRA